MRAPAGLLTKPGVRVPQIARVPEFCPVLTLPAVPPAPLVSASSRVSPPSDPSTFPPALLKGRVHAG